MSDPLSFEVVHYSAPMPRSAESLTAMGLIFDRVIFPGVYFPLGEYDEKAYRKELERLKTLTIRDYDTLVTVAMFDFVRHHKTLAGFCDFTGTANDVFGDTKGIPAQLLGDLELAIHGPRPPNWEPFFDTGYCKGLPDSNESVSYPGPLHYHAKAIVESSTKGIPLLNDDDNLPVPHLSGGSPVGDAKALAGLLAIHCTSLVLPTMKVMNPTELMEFRDENKKPLRSFRRAMLRHAANLNDQLKGVSEEDIKGQTEFYIQTKILPDLDELEDLMRRSNRTWTERGKEIISMVVELGAALVATDRNTAIATAILKNIPGFLISEFAARKDGQTTHSRSDLYYLLKLKKLV